MVPYNARHILTAALREDGVNEENCSIDNGQRGLCQHLLYFLGLCIIMIPENMN